MRQDFVSSVSSMVLNNPSTCGLLKQGRRACATLQREGTYSLDSHVPTNCQFASQVTDQPSSCQLGRAELPDEIYQLLLQIRHSSPIVAVCVASLLWYCDPLPYGQWLKCCSQEAISACRLQQKYKLLLPGPIFPTKQYRSYGNQRRSQMMQCRQTSQSSLNVSYCNSCPNAGALLLIVRPSLLAS